MKKLTYLFLGLLIFACSSDDGGSNNDQSSCPIYLDSNGITIKACEDANGGDTGVINGVTYTVVDETMLRAMIDNEEDVTKVVTTKITDMTLLFFLGFDDNGYIYNDFNQDISSWDVSKVTDMGLMFSHSAFNQPIGNWDVSNVFNMSYMFDYADAFNQDLSAWSVDGVIYCYGFKSDSPLTEANTPNFTNCNP